MTDSLIERRGDVTERQALAALKGVAGSREALGRLRQTVMEHLQRAGVQGELAYRLVPIELQRDRPPVLEVNVLLEVDLDSPGAARLWREIDGEFEDYLDALPERNRVELNLLIGFTAVPRVNTGV